jgi:hypothetical protein
MAGNKCRVLRAEPDRRSRRIIRVTDAAQRNLFDRILLVPGVSDCMKSYLPFCAIPTSRKGERLGTRIGTRSSGQRPGSPANPNHMDGQARKIIFQNVYFSEN